MKSAVAILFLSAVAGIIYTMRNCAIVSPVEKVSESLTIFDYMRFTERWEGKENKVYTCPAGFKTVGVGHKIREDESFSGVLSDSQIENIFRRDMTAAIVSAKRNVKMFETLPNDIKLIIVDINFNCGGIGFSKFKKTISALNTHDFSIVADELQNSLWSRQTGRRAKHHIEKIRTLK